MTTCNLTLTMARMTRTTLLLILTAVLALDLCSVAGAQPAYPQRTDAFVDDIARVIEPQDEAAIRQLLQDLRASRGVEAAVVTIGSIDDYSTGDKTIETFATHLFNAWGLGDAQRNDGVLILVAIDDRQVRIELGMGYDTGHEDRMATVIKEHFLSDFRNGRYSAGILSGVRAMVRELTGEWPATPGGTLGQGGETMSGLAAPPNRPTGLLNSPENLLVGLGVLFFVAMGIYTVITVVRDAMPGRAVKASSSQSDDDDKPSKSLFDHSSLTGSSIDSSGSSSSSGSSVSGGGGRSSGGGASGTW
jgi:uncharacterized protein